jgi:hypothetical protein
MTNVRAYTEKQLLAKVKTLGSYRSVPQGYWLLGVRSNEDETNKFDDKIYLFNGETFVMVAPGTTNPGSPILQLHSVVTPCSVAICSYFFNHRSVSVIS